MTTPRKGEKTVPNVDTTAGQKGAASKLDDTNAPTRTENRQRWRNAFIAFCIIFVVAVILGIILVQVLK